MARVVINTARAAKMLVLRRNARLVCAVVGRDAGPRVWDVMVICFQEYVALVCRRDVQG
jgi:hypothetical protein